MAEAFSEIWAVAAEILSIPVIKFFVYIPLALLPIFTFFRLLVLDTGCDFCIDFSGFGSWLKNKFIDLLKKLFGFDFIYKHGLARLGVDYVECDSQFCGDCPFQETCPAERQAQFSHLGQEVTPNE